MFITQDKLWKAIFEDFFPHAIAFYFPKLYPKIDWSRGFEMLDKELKKIYPESKEMHRRTDVLVKVWLLNGTEQWILIHVEVQGYHDEDFPRRMYVYFYRLTDRFKVPVATLAVLTDHDKEWLPDRYEYRLEGTSLTYIYPIYKLALHTEEEYEGMKNPWAIIMKVALIGLKRNWDDESLLKIKVRLYREFRGLDLSVEQATAFLHFLKYHVRFGKQEYFNNFDEEILIVDHQKQQPMGVVELVKQGMLIEAREEGREEGMEKGMEKGREEGMEKGELEKARKVIMRILEKYPSWSDEEIAEVVEMPARFVQQVRLEMQKLKSNRFRKK